MTLKNDIELASTAHEIDDLQQKTVAQLQIRYQQVFGEVSRSNHKQFLVRRIAWRLQAVAEGDLSQRARDRALSLARDADLRLRAPAAGIGPPGRRRDPRLPRPGTSLTRVFRDGTVTVTVLENGFQYEDRVYRSLSAVARHISGTQWNGFSFFQLQGREDQ